jgi:hypothetical protein
MATRANINERNGSRSLDGLTLANVDLSDRELVAELRERDLQAAELRIKEEVRRLQDLGIIDARGRREWRISPSVRSSVNREFQAFVEDDINTRRSFAFETTLRTDVTLRQAGLARLRALR